MAHKINYKKYSKLGTFALPASGAINIWN